MVGSVGPQSTAPVQAEGTGGRARIDTTISRSCGAFISKLEKHESELSSGAQSHRDSMAGKCRPGN